MSTVFGYGAATGILVTRYDKVTTAWDAYNEVQNFDTALNFVQAVAQFAAVAAVAGLTETGIGKFLQKTGWARQLDAIRKGQTLAEYKRNQQGWRIVGGFSVAWLVDTGIDKLNDSGVLSDLLVKWDPLGLMPEDVNSFWNQFKNWTPPRRDPLAIDMDGDGIETTGADGTVLFDHNGDGVKTGTGWVSADDGFIVLDRNDNGTIDSGAELFGVDTVKTDGSFATDGFDALSDLDSNGDGVFNAQDTEFANVRIWQDLDQDGISDTGELTSLTDAGIVSIDLDAESDNVNLGNGNVQSAAAAHLTVDGTEGTTGNLELAHNPFYREFTDSIALTEKAKGLPESYGSGMVRDLREAMSLSSSLAAIVSNYAEQTTYTGQRELLDSLVEAWAGTSTLQTSIDVAEENDLELFYTIPGQEPADFTPVSASAGGGGIYTVKADPKKWESGANPIL